MYVLVPRQAAFRPTQRQQKSPRCASWLRCTPIYLPRFFLALSDQEVLQVFLNIVLDDAVEEKAGGEKVRIGMVVRGA